MKKNAPAVDAEGFRLLNATIVKPATCNRCRAALAVCDRACVYRERALSSREAAHHGLYPKRIHCGACVAHHNSQMTEHRAQAAAENQA